MKPLAEFPEDAARRIDFVFAGIDNTLTREGRLTAASYQATEDLSVAGVAVIPATGCPAGWCDMIARFWPVADVVGENGAFYYSYDHGAKAMRHVFAGPAETRRENQQKLARIHDRVLAEVPGAAISADQAFSETDLTIDFFARTSLAFRPKTFNESRRFLERRGPLPRSRLSTSMVGSAITTSGP